VGDLVRLPLLFGRPLLTEPYLAGLPIVPVVMLGYLFLGCSNVFTAGIHIEKRTHLLPGITLAGALLNVAANYLLIPRLGIMGAALATLVSYAVMALLAFLIVRRFYPVPYEWSRLAKLAAATAAAWLLFLVRPAPVAPALWGLALLLLFAGLLALMRFFRRDELHALRAVFDRRSGGGTSAPSEPPAA